MTSEGPLTGADVERLASWSAQSVGIGEVCSALTDLRHGEETTATRTSVLNLVVVGDDPEAAARAASAMRRLGQRHPGRTVSLVCSPDRPEGIDATVELHAANGDETAVWWEEVALSLGGQLCDHLASVVMPLLLAGLPTAVWYPSALPAPEDPLLGLADVVLVDARWALQAGSGLAALVELSRRHELIDLSWCRLTPWRRLLASLFEPRDLRPYLRGVTSAEVAANPGPGRLLAGWIVDRLGVDSSAVGLTPAVHASIHLSATHAGHQARFSVERPNDDPLVLGATEAEDVPNRHESVSLPDHGLTWSLAQALSKLARDPRYDAAIRAALAFEE